MAEGAVGAELSVVIIIFGVATVAILRRPFKRAARRVACQTIHIGMFARQRERRPAVVEGGIFPAHRVVAGGAIGAELPIVRVFCRVTAVAVGGGVGVHVVDMARLTFHLCMTAHQSEAGAAVVEVDIAPIRRVVAEGAIGAELPVVIVIFGVTTVAILRRPFKRAARRMARQTIHIGMFTHQRERRLAVVEAGVFPAGWGMAGGAVGAELPVVLIIFGVATVAILRRVFICIVDVTGFALHIGMPIHQREAGQIVVEGGIIPIGGVVAHRAVGAELAIVVVVFGVATVAIGGGVDVYVVDMARFTLDIHMFSGEGKAGDVVVKGIIFPIRGVVANGAVRAELPIVLVIFGVATVAILRRPLQFREAGRAPVTTGAGAVGVFALQPETDQIMVEGCPQRPGAIVARQTPLPERLDMGSGEARVNLPMARFAVGRIKPADIFAVASLTGERRSVALSLVARQ